jgi:hypothetical protein
VASYVTAAGEREGEYSTPPSTGGGRQFHDRTEHHEEWHPQKFIFIIRTAIGRYPHWRLIFSPIADVGAAALNILFDRFDQQHDSGRIATTGETETYRCIRAGTDGATPARRLAEFALVNISFFWSLLRNLSRGGSMA